MAEISHPVLQRGRSKSILRRPDLAIVALAVVTLTGVGLALQGATYLNHDIAWVLYSTRQMLHGAVYGRDIVEVNPPLIWFLSMPAVLASQTFGWPLDATFRIFCAAVALGMLAYVSAALRAEPYRERSAIVLLLAYFMFVGCYRDYGQREYLSIALVMSYLMAAAARMEGRCLNAVAATIIGIAAGLGLAFKPFFLAVPLLVEAAVLVRSRSPRMLLSPELLAMAAAGLIYVVVAVVLTPDYFTKVVPLIAGTFWGFNEEASKVLGRIRFDLVGLATLLGFYAFGRRPALLTVVIAAALGYMASYLVQFKGYSYHEFPLRVLIPLGLMMQLFDFAGSKAPRHRSARAFAAGTSVALVLVLASNLTQTMEWYRLAARPDGVLARETSAMIRLVEDNAQGGAFLALSTHPFPGFPTALYANARWADRSNSTILLPAIVKMRDGVVPSEPAQLARLEALARGWFLRDLVEDAPKLVLVDIHEERHAIGTLPFDFLAFYLEDPQIRAAWRMYREALPIDGYRVFLRQEGPP